MRAMLLAASVAALALSLPNAASAQRVGINNGGCTFNTIGAAVAAAVSGDTIRISPGSYDEAGIVITSTDLDIQSANASCLGAPAGGVDIFTTGTTRIFDITSSDVRFEGLSIGTPLTRIVGDGGVVRARTNSEVDFVDVRCILARTTGRGGCIYASQSDITTVGATEFDRCDADVAGGAVYLDTLSTMVAFQSVFKDNSTDGTGGAIHVRSADLGSNSTFERNTADRGGAVFVNASPGNVSVADIADGTLIANSAQQGGAIAAETVWATVRVRGQAVLTENTADDGGAIHLEEFAFLEMLTEPQITFNDATGSGGGIYADSASTISITGQDLDAILFRENTANAGGGIYLDETDLDATFVRFEDNAATSAGGAIYGRSDFSPASTVMELRNVRVHDNTAQYGGGIFGLRATLNMGSDFQTCSAAGLPQDTFCSELVGNATVVSGGFGGGLRLLSDAVATVQSTYFRENSATDGAAASVVTGASLTLRNALLVENVPTSGVRAISAASGTTVDIFSSTFADNVTPMSYGTGVSGVFHRNIVWGNTNDVSASTVSGNCNITQTAAGAPTGGRNVQADPLYDATNARSVFKLGAGSPGIDACGAGPSRDLDGRSRPRGVRFDRGAFEML